MIKQKSIMLTLNITYLKKTIQTLKIKQFSLFRMIL